MTMVQDRLLFCGHEGCRKQVADQELEIHMRRHFLYYPYQCYVCRGEFADEEQLKSRHFPRKHPKDRVRVLINEDFDLENKVVDAMATVRIENTQIKTEMSSDISFESSCWRGSSYRESTPGPLPTDDSHSLATQKLQQAPISIFESSSSSARDEKSLAGLHPKREVDWSLIEASVADSCFPDPQLNSTLAALPTMLNDSISCLNCPRIRPREAQIEEMVTPPLKRTKAGYHSKAPSEDPVIWGNGLQSNVIYENLVCDFNEISSPEDDGKQEIAEKDAIKKHGALLLDVTAKHPSIPRSQPSETVVRRIEDAFSPIEDAAAEKMETQNASHEIDNSRDNLDSGDLPGNSSQSCDQRSASSTGSVKGEGSVPNPSAFEQAIAAPSGETSSSRPDIDVQPKQRIPKSGPSLVQTYGIKISKGKASQLKTKSIEGSDSPAVEELGAVEPSREKELRDEVCKEIGMFGTPEISSADCSGSSGAHTIPSGSGSPKGCPELETPRSSKKSSRKSLLLDLQNMPPINKKAQKRSKANPEKQANSRKLKGKKQGKDELTEPVEMALPTGKENSECTIGFSAFSSIDLCKFEPISPEKLPLDYPTTPKLSEPKVNPRKSIKLEILGDEMSESTSEPLTALPELSPSPSVKVEILEQDNRSDQFETSSIGDSSQSIPEVKDTASATENELCYLCQKLVEEGQDGLVCDVCEGWVHRECCKITPGTFRRINRLIASMDENYEFPWKCPSCNEIAAKESSDPSSELIGVNAETNALHTVHLEEKKARKDERMRHLGLLRQQC